MRKVRNRNYEKCGIELTKSEIEGYNDTNQSDNRYEEGNREAWRALEEAYEAGNKSDG